MGLYPRIPPDLPDDLCPTVDQINAWRRLPPPVVIESITPARVIVRAASRLYAIYPSGRVVRDTPITIQY